MTLDLPNELEYLMVSVPKPAGCEPINPLSGWDAQIARVIDDPNNPDTTDNGRPIYREERDDKSVFFLNHLDAGKWQIRFGLRAVTPGEFHVLPVQALAMYVTEICANGDSLRLKIEPSK